MMLYKVFLAVAVLAPRVLGGSATALGNLLMRAETSGDLVMTPVGLVPKENAHFVPEGARVEHSDSAIHIIGSDGTILHTSPISESRNTHSPLLNPTTLSPRAYTDGYAAYSYWGPNSNASAISQFSTTWTVPSVPASANGQLLYIFNALVPTSLDTILQPVLQFGVSSAGGVNYWAVASWYVNGAVVYYSTLSQVKPGQVVSGVMSLQGNKTVPGLATTYTYNTAFSGIASSSMNISSKEIFTYTYEALEIYTTSGASNLPTGKTAMSAINIVNQNGQHPAVKWTASSNTAEGFGVTLVNNTGISGEIDLIYPTH